MGDRIGYTRKIVLFNCILFSCYFIISTILIVNIIKANKEKADMDVRQDSYHRLQEYTNQIENMYSSLPPSSTITPISCFPCPVIMSLSFPTRFLKREFLTLRWHSQMYLQRGQTADWGYIMPMRSSQNITLYFWIQRFRVNILYSGFGSPDMVKAGHIF